MSCLLSGSNTDIHLWSSGDSSGAPCLPPSSATSHSLTLQVTPSLDVSYHKPGSGPGADNTEWRAQVRPQGAPGSEAAEMRSCPPPEVPESRHTSQNEYRGRRTLLLFLRKPWLSFQHRGKMAPAGGSRELHRKTASGAGMLSGKGLQKTQDSQPRTAEGAWDQDSHESFPYDRSFHP